MDPKSSRQTVKPALNKVKGPPLFRQTRRFVQD